MNDVDDRLRELLRDRAADIASPWEMPPRLHTRARRRLAVTIGCVIVAAAVLALGAFAGVRSLLRANEPRPANVAPTTNGEIAFVGRALGDGSLWLVDPRTGETRTLVRRCPPIEEGCAAWIGSIDWAPDGIRLAYTLETKKRRAGPAGIYVLDVRSGETTRLTSCANPCRIQTDLDWSPDGTRIAYTQLSGGGCTFAVAFDGRCSIWLVGTDGSAPVELPTGSLTDPVDPSWSPDGLHIAFSAREGKRAWSLYTVARDGSNLSRVATGHISTDPVHPAWSPDGTTIALLMTGAPHPGYGALWTVAADGSDPRFVADLGCCVGGGANGGPTGPEWSPDGTKIAVTGGSAGQPHLLILDREGHEVADLGRAWWAPPSWRPAR